MKRPRKTTLLGLVVLIGVLPLFFSGCDEKQRLRDIKSELDNIDKGVGNLNRRFAKATSYPGSDSHLIVVDDSLNTSLDVAELSKGQRHEIVWIALEEDTKLEVNFTKPSGSPFKKFKTLTPRVTASGPIDKGVQTPNYYEYEVCVTPAHGTRACKDPGIIIHP